MGRAIILPQQRANRRGYLALGYSRYIGHFSERWSVRPDHRNPNILGAIDVLVMILPLFEAAPASVIGGDNKRDLVAICRHASYSKAPQ
jgi:hypothetical protein